MRELDPSANKNGKDTLYLLVLPLFHNKALAEPTSISVILIQSSNKIIATNNIKKQKTNKTIPLLASFKIISPKINLHM